MYLRCSIIELIHILNELFYLYSFIFLCDFDRFFFSIAFNFLTLNFNINVSYFSFNLFIFLWFNISFTNIIILTFIAFLHLWI